MRFARAKGSKASNVRIPEAATSWQDMKEGLVKKGAAEHQEVCETKRKKQEAIIEKAEGKKIIKKKLADFEPLVGEALNSSNQKSKSKKRKIQEVDQISKKAKKKNERLKIEENTEGTEGINSSENNKYKNKQKNQKFAEAKHNKYNKQQNKNKEFKRRKPGSEVDKVFINGNEVHIAYFDGFPIKKDDADRLKQLRKEMISKGLPRSEISKALKLERRKAEKSLAREKKKVCFNCRYSGHTLSECPELQSGANAQATETGICFKCGSTEHTHFECKVTHGDNYKFAQCFICKEQGHIARQCPDNSRGLYPKGGACRVCGDVTHLKKDCPKYQSEQQEKKVVAHTIDNDHIESLENEAEVVRTTKKKSQKVIKF